MISADNITYHSLKDLSPFLAQKRYSKVIVLCDSNTVEACLPYFNEQSQISMDHLIVIPAGERHKTLQTCSDVWQQLVDCGADRYTLLINLGGGVVGDLGGFCAATYMRGIDFIQVPTSLLAQVDASVGGKTGIDFNHYKNMVGVFAQSNAVYIDTAFLRTLPPAELRSGFVEMIKHALIADRAIWEDMQSWPTLSIDRLRTSIPQSVQIKHNIVVADPLESGLRKQLNFGHTVGHALERLILSRKQHIRHGEAVAFGIVVAIALSRLILNFSSVDARNIVDYIRPFCSQIPSNTDISSLIEIMRSDKKNKNQSIRFVLLKSIGEVCTDQEVDEQLIINCIEESIAQF